MDMHRLRVVEFDTSVSEKEGEKKYITKHEEYKQEDRKTSTDRNKHETRYENQCLSDNTSPLGLSKKRPGYNISPPGTSKEYLDVTSSPPTSSKKCPDNKIGPAGPSEKYLDDTTSTSPPETSKTDSFARSKSKSEIKFKIPSRNKPRKRVLKINSSDLAVTKLFQDSAYLHQKKRTFNLRNRNSRVHHKVENVKGKNEEVKFLFARNTPSFLKYCNTRAKNEITTAKTKGDSELPNDIYGFQNSNRSLDQYQYRMAFPNFIDTDKKPFKKLRRGIKRKPTPPEPVVATDCACKHHKMRVLHSESAFQVGRRPSIYYSLGMHAVSSQSKRDSDQEEGFGRERSYYMAKDETVEVSPSSLEPVSTRYRDAGTGPCKVEASTVCHRHPLCVSEESPAAVNNVTTTREGIKEPTRLPCSPNPCAAPTQNKSKQKCNKMKNTEFFTNIPLRFMSRFAKHLTIFHEQRRLAGGNCIKNFLCGVLFVVWSPCLLAVILVWVLMFPAKMTSILKTDKSKRSCSRKRSLMKGFCKKAPRCEYQRMCFENYLPKNKKSFMSSAASWYSRTAGAVVNTLTSLFKLKKKAPMCAGSSFLPSSHPNPRKKYTLFYADNRGWVMKPLRRKNPRSSTSTRVVQSMRCEVRPKLACLKKLPQKLKYVCPNNTRRTLPTARNVCVCFPGPPWPNCACWDKYSQGSSKFTRVESRRRRQQQVNISPTFSYPTSGIAFNPADKTINVKELHSNNIASKDLGKHRLGQRKNGTLPFGVVCNQPCGAKYPLITNLETFRAHKFGLAGKTLNMSTKCTPSLVIKGLQGQLPKCWTKHVAAKAVNKSPGSVGVRNSVPIKHISIHRQNTKREEAFNCHCGRNHKSAIINKKYAHQKNLNFRNKCVLKDISQSTGTKQANTSTYKINYAHKTQNTSKHIHKVKVKKSEKAKPDMDSKCAKHSLPIQTYIYRTDKTRVPTQKPDIVLNYSFRKKSKQFKEDYNYNPFPVPTRKQSNTARITINTNHNKAINYPRGEKHKQTKQANKYKLHQVPAATQKQSNKTDITTSTNVDIALNCPCGEEHEQSKQPNKYKPHQVSVGTQKQSNKANITTRTNRNKALNYAGGEKHKQFTQANKYKLHQVPAATQKQSNKTDITTSTNVDIALNCPCGEEHEQSKQPNNYKPHQVSVGTQKQSNKANITTRTNRNKALNYAGGEKHKQFTQANKYKLHQVSAATQKQSNKTDITTSTKVDIALNCPCGEKHEQSKQPHQYKPHQVPVGTQKQSNKAIITTRTNRNKALNYAGGDKHKQFTQTNRYKPHQVPVAVQKQSNKADITIDSKVDIALNCPCDEKREQSKHGYKHQPHRIPNATQVQSRTADNTTMTNRDIALNFSCEENHEQYKNYVNNAPHHMAVTIQKQSRTADNTTMTNRDTALDFSCEENHEQYKHYVNNAPHQMAVTIQKQSRTADNTAMTNRDIALNGPCDEKHEQSKHGYKRQPHRIPNATQVQSRTADNTTMTNRDIALDFSCEENHEQCKHYFNNAPHQIAVVIQKQWRTADNTTMTNRDIALNGPYDEKHEQSKHGYKHQPHRIPNATQVQSRTADDTTMTNRDIALDFSCEENHEQYKHYVNNAPHHMAVTIQKQSRTADNTTMTNRDIALNGPCGEKHEQSKHGYKHQPHQIPNATQMQSRTADNTTMTNRDIALDFSCEENHEQHKHYFNNAPHQIAVTIQKQSRTADNTTMTNIALNGLSEEEHEQYKHRLINDPHEVPTQIQSKTADNTTMTNRDLAFNYFDAVKPPQTYKYIPETRKREQSKQYYKYKPDHKPVATQKQSSSADTTTMTNRDIALSYSIGGKLEQSNQAYTCQPYLALNYLGAVKPNTAKKNILCIPSTTDKDTTCTHKIRSQEYMPKKQDISTQKNTSKIETSVYCTIDYERGETKELVRPVQTVFPKKAADCTISCCASTSWDWGGEPGGSRKLNGPGLFKGTQTIASLNPEENKVEGKPELSKRGFTKEMVDCGCGCGAKLKPIATATELPSEQADENTFAHYPSKLQTLAIDCTSPKSSNVTIVQTSRVSTTQLLSPRQIQTDELLKQFQPHANSPLFEISSDYCHSGGTPQQNKPAKEMHQIATDSRKKYTHETSTVKEPPSQQPKSKQALSHTLQVQLKSFTTASDCVCGTKKPIAAENSFHKVTGSKSHIVKETQSKSLAFHPSAKRDKLSHHSYQNGSANKALSKNEMKETEAPTLKESSSTKPSELSPPSLLASSPTDKDSRKSRAVTEAQSEHLQHLSIQDPKLSEQSRHSSRTTPVIDRQGVTSDPVTAHPRQSRIMTETPPNTCHCNSEQGLELKSRQHLPSAQPDTQLSIASDCPCGVTPQIGQVSNSTARKTSLRTDGQPEFSQHFSSRQPDIPKVDNTSKFSKSPEHLASKISQATSTPFAIASDCRCGVTPQIGQVSNSTARTTSLGTDGQPEFSQDLPSVQPDIPKVDNTSKLSKSPEHLASKISQATSTLFGIASDCRCGVTPEIGQVSNSTARKTSLRTDGQPEFSQHLPSVQSDIPIVDNTSKFSKSTEHLASKISQATSTPFGIASDCRCGIIPQQNEPDTETHKTSLIRAHPNQQSKLTEASSHTLQEQPILFGIASDCTCGQNQQIAAENSLVTGFKSHTASGNQTKSPPALKKSSISLLPHKLESLRYPVGKQPYGTKVSTTSSKRNVVKVDKTQSKFPKLPYHSTPSNPVGKQPYGTKVSTTSSKRNVVKVDKAQSKFPKLPYHSTPSKSIPHECRCPVERLQDPVGEQSNGTKVNTTSSDRNVVKVDKTPSKFPKSPHHSTPSKSIPHECQCPVERLQEPVGEQPNGTKVNTTSSDRNVVKVDKTPSKFPKSPHHSTPSKSIPHECQCPVERLQDPVGEQPNGTKVNTTSSDRNVVKVDKTQSKFPKSPHHSTPSKSFPHECRCPVERLQDPVGEQPNGTKVNTTSSDRNVVKVDKPRSWFSKSNKHPPPQQNVLHECQCPVENHQDSIREKTSQRSWKSIFSRKSKRKLSVLHNITGQFSIQSRERTEGNSVNKPSSRVQNRSKVIRLVMSLRSKLFNRKISKQTKIPDNPTKKTSQLSILPQYFSNTSCRLCHYPDKDTGKTSLHTRKSMLDGESNRSIFQRSHKLKTSKNSSLEIHSSHNMFHSSCSCVIQQSSSRQYPKKTRYMRKPLLVDKSYPCLGVAKTSHEPSYPSRSSRLECRCHAENTSSLRLSSKISCYSYPRLSRRIRSQQSKTSEHSSIAMSQTPVEYICSSDEIFMNNNRRSFQKHDSHKLSEKQSILTQYLSLSQTMIPGTCRCVGRHLGKTTSRQSNSRSRHCPNRPQEPTSTQKQSSKKFDPLYTSSLNNYQPTSIAKQPVPSQHPLSQEPLKSRSSLFNRSQSKPLVEKIRSITDKISSNSLKNKQEITPNKSGCWPEKLYKVSKKLSQLSRKSVEKISPSETPPHLLTAQSTLSNKTSRKKNQEKKSSYLSAQTAPIIQSKCACWPEKLHELSKKISQHSRKSVEKTTTSKPSTHLRAQSTQPCENPHQTRVRAEAQAENPQYISIRQPKVSKQSRQCQVFEKRVRAQPNIPLIYSLHRSSQSKQLTEKVDKQFDVISQQPEHEQVIPIIPGKCRCAEQKMKTEYSPSNRLQPNTDLQNLLSNQRSRSHNSQGLPSDTHRFQPSTAVTTLGTDGQAQFSQHLPSVQTEISKLDSLHRSIQSKQLTANIENQFDAIPQQLKAARVTPIFPGKCRCAGEQNIKTSNNKSQQIQPSRSPNSHGLPSDTQRFQSSTASHPTHESSLRMDAQPEFSQHLPSMHPDISKIDSLRRSIQSKQLTEKVDKQFDAISQQPEHERVIPIIPGRCRCAEQKMKTEYSPSNRLQPNTDLQNFLSNQRSRSHNSHGLPSDTHRFQSSTALHSTLKSTLGTDGQAQFSQHLPSVQPDISKLDSLHRSIQSKQLTANVETQFDAVRQQLEAERETPIFPGKCRCAEQKMKTEYSPSNRLQPNTDLQNLLSNQHSRSHNSHGLPSDTHRFQSSTASHSTLKSTLGTDGQAQFSQHLPSVPTDISKLDSLHRSIQSKHLTENVENQQLEAERVTPIFPGKCKCAGEQNIKTKRSSNNKSQQIQPSRSPNSPSETQRFQSSTASHPTRKKTLGSIKQTKFSVHMQPNQPRETPAFKLLQPLPSQEAHILHSTPLHNSKPKKNNTILKKPCTCRLSKHGNEQEIPNSLHKVAKAQSPGISHYSTEKLKKSHLISCVYPVCAKKKRLREVIIQRTDISQSSKNPRFPPNPQFHVYQQNLQSQKQLSQIPTNLDEPPPGLLQQYAPGRGRTGKAEGGVQQPYPDFNRVSMRYPGNNAPRKQSISGLSQPPPTFMPPPPPKAAPPPKYARDPCYTNLGNRCAPKSPYDESALRRAYKRRPLRYTPPRQTAPRAVMEKKLKEHKKKATMAKKRRAQQSKKTNFFRCLRDLVNQTEREAWPHEVTCHPLWVHALKEKPCFWIYRMCPRIYPAFLNCYKFQTYIGQMIVYLLTICFWSPLLVCGYFCCDVMCTG